MNQMSKKSPIMELTQEINGVLDFWFPSSSVVFWSQNPKQFEAIPTAPETTKNSLLKKKKKKKKKKKNFF